VVNSKRAQLQQLDRLRINLWITYRGQHQFSNLWWLATSGAILNGSPKFGQEDR